MESKAARHDLSQDTYTFPPMTSPYIAPQHIDLGMPPPSDEDSLVPESSASSSPYSSAKSPGTSIDLNGSAVSPGQDDASSDVSQRRRSSGSSRADREKRKRSRVTPEQLAQLERLFATDRSPTAARRKEISDMLGMQERQTQIWFQNRRAKAKLLDGKTKTRTTVTPPTSPPELSPGFEVDLHNLLHENEQVMIIPCSDLSIGTWRRMATPVGKYDLVAYVCDSRQCLTWFIHSSGYGFKMEVPFSTIKNTEFTNAAPGQGLASFWLTQPPIFYLEDVGEPNPDGTINRTWKRCADWTEGQQATKILRHDLIGSAVQLAHVLRNFNANTSSADIHLHPAYNVRTDSPSGELTPMPTSGSSAPRAGYNANQYSDQLLDPSCSPPMDTRRRSFSSLLDPLPQDHGEYPPLPIESVSHGSRLSTPGTYQPFIPLPTAGASSSLPTYTPSMYLDMHDTSRPPPPSPLGQYQNLPLPAQQHQTYNENHQQHQQSFFPPAPASAAPSHPNFGAPASGMAAPYHPRVSVERRASGIHVDVLSPPLLSDPPPPSF